jgi:hypothetical protein
MSFPDLKTVLFAPRTRRNLYIILQLAKMIRRCLYLD